MNTQEAMLEPFSRMVADMVTPERLRAADRGELASDMWSMIEESGFADALVPEAHGGAGLALADVHPLLLTCGEYLMPQALGSTMVARALLASAFVEFPRAPIVLWPAGPDGTLRSLARPSIAEGEFALVHCGAQLQLQRLRAATESDGFGMVQAKLDGSPIADFDSAGTDLLILATAVTAASMAGAMAHLLRMTIEFANERTQFGRPLGKFQAVQHELSRAAEHVAMAATASQLPFAGNSLASSPLRVAIAKCIADEAADVVCAIAHGVHGAIGITDEYNLQFYTRRVKRWQASFGSRAFWASQLGTAHRESQCATAVDFLRTL